MVVALTPLRGFMNWCGRVWLCYRECEARKAIWIKGYRKKREWQLFWITAENVSFFNLTMSPWSWVKMLWKQKGNKTGLITGILITLGFWIWLHSLKNQLSVLQSNLLSILGFCLLCLNYFNGCIDRDELICHV